jgi:hypothetical protein
MPAGKRDGWLERCHEFVVRCIVLGITLLFCLGIVLLLIPATRPSVGDFLAVIETNWTATTLFLIVLFYRPIRNFMERIEEVAGVRAGKPQTPEPLPPMPEPPPGPGHGSPAAGLPSEPRS